MQGLGWTHSWQQNIYRLCRKKCITAQSNSQLTYVLKIIYEAGNLVMVPTIRYDGYLLSRNSASSWLESSSAVDVCTIESCQRVSPPLPPDRVSRVACRVLGCVSAGSGSGETKTNSFHQPAHNRPLFALCPTTSYQLHSRHGPSIWPTTTSQGKASSTTIPRQSSHGGELRDYCQDIGSVHRILAFRSFRSQ